MSLAIDQYRLLRRRKPKVVIEHEFIMLLLRRTWTMCHAHVEQPSLANFRARIYHAPQWPTALFSELVSEIILGRRYQCFVVQPISRSSPTRRVTELVHRFQSYGGISCSCNMSHLWRFDYDRRTRPLVSFCFQFSFTCLQSSVWWHPKTPISYFHILPVPPALLAKASSTTIHLDSCHIPAAHLRRIPWTTANFNILQE